MRFDGFDDFNAAAFAAAARVNLRFNDPYWCGQRLCDCHGFSRSKGYSAIRNINAVFFEKALALIFMNIHEMVSIR